MLQLSAPRPRPLPRTGARGEAAGAGQAAKLGQAQSMFNLAAHYFKGRGVRRHLRKAAYWFLESARRGVPAAQLEAGARYLTGSGLRRDPDKGLAWLRKAAHAGEPSAEALLAAVAEGAEATAAALLELGMLQSGMPADGPGGRRAAGGGLAASGGSHADLQARLQAQLDEARRRRAASEAVTANGRTQRPKVAHPRAGRRPRAPLAANGAAPRRTHAPRGMRTARASRALTCCCVARQMGRRMEAAVAEAQLLAMRRQSMGRAGRARGSSDQEDAGIE
jgi:hypothetical protein